MDNIKRAQTARLIYIIAGALAGLIGIIALIFVTTLLEAANYVPMVILFVVSAAGLYGSVFLLFFAFDHAVAVRLIPVAEELGSENIKEIAERFGWRESITEKYISKCKKWGYIK